MKLRIAIPLVLICLISAICSVTLFDCSDGGEVDYTKTDFTFLEAFDYGKARGSNRTNRREWWRKIYCG